MHPPEAARSPRFGAALFLVLLAIGAAHWAWMFGIPPRVPHEKADWPKEVRYYAVLKQAVTESRVPYYVSRPVQETRKFLAIPETVLSPQIVALRWVGVDVFLLANVVMLHAAGTAGCLLLRRRYSLAPPAFILLWLLLSFGGHITAHLAIGHSMWGGYFFLPFFFLLVLDTGADAVGRWPIAMGLTLAAMLWQGSFHVFVWCVIFLFLQMLVDRRRAAIATALTWSAALGLARLAPAALFLQDRREAEFQTGYPSAVVLLQGLAWIRDAAVPRTGGGSMGGLQWWEFDTYVGPVALAWLVWFGGRGLARRERPWRVVTPVAVLALWSLDRLYAPVHALNLPLLGSQRVTSRFLVVPLLMLAVAAAIESTRWAASASRARTIGLWVAAAVTAVLLGAHSHTWRTERIDALLPNPPHARDVEIVITPPAIGEPKNGLYLGSVRLSAFASAAACGLALWRWRAVSRRSSR